MKKVFSLSLAAFLLAAVLCAALIAPLTAAAEEARYEVFDLTAKDAVPEDASTWYTDGVIIAVTNDGSSEKTIASGEYPMRYLFILIFDKDGVCVELGNNLLTADDEKAASFPQHDVKIPAGGFVVLFYYNANEGPTNLALYEYYNDLGGAAITNETGKVTSGKTYMAELEGNTVTVYFGAKGETPDASDASDASAEEPVEESSEASIEESSEASIEESSEASVEESSEPSVEESSEAASDVSSEAPESASESSAPAASSAAESDADASQGDDGGSNVPLIVGIVIAVVAVAAIVVIVIAKKK